mmetsp:Transcript_16650/g.41196  ORF Transcript_16650/g.41196 Transcript_16650/m.41196 type:complete len:229 (-) Transcript_16650:668-1354(-)
MRNSSKKMVKYLLGTSPQTLGSPGSGDSDSITRCRSFAVSTPMLIWCASSALFSAISRNMASVSLTLNMITSRDLSPYVFGSCARNSVVLVCSSSFATTSTVNTFVSTIGASITCRTASIFGIFFMQLSTIAAESPQETKWQRGIFSVSKITRTMSTSNFAQRSGEQRDMDPTVDFENPGKSMKMQLKLFFTKCVANFIQHQLVVRFSSSRHPGKNITNRVDFRARTT